MSVEKMNLYVNVGFTILMIIIGIFAIRALRQYFVKKEITGNLVFHLQKSPKTIVILGALAAWYIYMRGRSFLGTIEDMDLFFAIMISIINIEIIVIFVIRLFLPQKIYENGVLNNTGFIPWSKIKRITESKESDRKISLVIRTSGKGGRDVELHCLPGTAPMIAEYIQKHISTNEYPVDQNNNIK